MLRFPAIRRLSFPLVFLLFAAPIAAPPQARARMETSILKTLALETAPRDIAVSSDGEWIFVLVESGEIRVFDAEGMQSDTLRVGSDIDGIETGPRPDILFLRSARSKSIRVLAIDPIRDIDTAGSPSKGPADAPVTIAVFSEFECPFCAQLSLLIEDVAAVYAETVRVAYKHYPLRRHPMSRPAALASHAAWQQGKFWEYQRKLYENQDNLTNEFLREAAEDLGLDMKRFRADMASPEAEKAIRKDIADAAEAGVRGVPAVFVNGRALKSRTVAGFQELIEKALAESAEKAE